MVSKKRYNKQIRRKSYKGGKANTPKYEPELTITPPINIQEIPDINDDIDDDDYNEDLNNGFYDDTDDDTDDDNERLDAKENAANIDIFGEEGGSKRKSKKRISKRRKSKRRTSKKRISKKRKYKK
jgi:hypothetical protein